MESVCLYYREGPSDKVYQAAIVPKDDGYLVTFAYGRRGSTLNVGTKTPRPSAWTKPSASMTSWYARRQPKDIR